MASSSTQLTCDLALQTELTDQLLDDPAVQALLAAPWSAWCDRWLGALAEDLPPAADYELTLRLTDDAHIQILNRQFRQQDRPTDVLAFAALEETLPPLPVTEWAGDNSDLIAEPLYLGDIVISLERAAQQAQERGHDFSLEVTWLFAHGLLHLLGWDHPDETLLATMLSQQSSLLMLIGLSPPDFV